jgi:hypothetical protein
MRHNDRSLRRSFTFPAVLILLAVIGACASGREGGGVGEGGIPIQVDNNLIPSVTLSILAAVDGTTPVRLGSLVPGEKQTFTFRPTVSGGTFRLVADRPGPGGALISEPIPFAPGDSLRVEWELATNNVLVR